VLVADACARCGPTSELDGPDVLVETCVGLTTVAIVIGAGGRVLEELGVLVS
jgi:hypothetical protein